MRVVDLDLTALEHGGASQEVFSFLEECMIKADEIKATAVQCILVTDDGRSFGGSSVSGKLREVKNS